MIRKILNHRGLEQRKREGREGGGGEREEGGGGRERGGGGVGEGERGLSG